MTTARKPAAARTQAETVADAVTKVVHPALAAGKETVETFVKAGAEAAQKGIEQAVQLSKEQVEKSATAVFKGYAELTHFSKDNIDAVFKAGTIYVNGLEQLSKAVVAFTQAQVDSNVAAAKAVLSCTSLRQVVDVQTDLAKVNFDKYVAEGSKLSEMTMKVANETLEPIQARVNATVEKFVRPAASAAA
jgi:phasin family protein